MPKINKYIDEELAAAESVSGTDKLLITQSGTPKAATITQLTGTVDLTGKADKVATSPAPTDYLAKFDADGNLAVSTKQESDIEDLTSPPAIGGTAAGNLQSKLVHLVKTASGSLTAQECTGTVVNNYGQADNMNLELPTAAEGLSLTVSLATTVAKYFRLTPATGETAALDGSSTGADKYIQIASATKYATIQGFTIQTGASTYEWVFFSAAGNWVQEA